MSTHVGEAPARRRFRLRLRTLMVVVFGCALVSTAVVWELRRIQDRRSAVAAVYASGGGVAYDDQWMPPGVTKRAWEPSWLRNLVGDSAFHDVTQVHWGLGPGFMTSTPVPVTDEQMAVLKAFPRLGSVVLWNAPRVTDKTLAYLSEVPDLWELNLAKVNISDAGLTGLKGLKNPITLILDDVPITDRGLSNLAGINLGTLIIARCPIDGSGLKHLGSSPILLTLHLDRVGVTDDNLAGLQSIRSLRYLAVRDTKTTDRGMDQIGALSELLSLWLGLENSSDEGLARLKGLTKLFTLGVKGPKVTNAGMKSLVMMKGLGQLTLEGTEVTDEGIKLLAGLPRLQYLDLSGSSVSDEAVDALKAARPGLFVKYTSIRRSGATSK